jgi:hypothetical protein
VSELAWPDPKIAVLQQEYSVSFKVNYEQVNWPLWLYVVGDPLAVLWRQMSFFTPFWYLKGDDDDY